MDWNMFWSAFGAIGTTLGTLITAVAVVVAVIQYKQPLIKRIRISFSTAFPVYDSCLGESFYCITVANTGIRNIIITNICLNVGKKNVLVNNLMRDLDPNNLGSEFPRELQPESSFSVYISYEELASAFADLLKRSDISARRKAKILVMDTTSGKHFKNMKVTAKQIAKNRG